MTRPFDSDPDPSHPDPRPAAVPRVVGRADELRTVAAAFDALRTGTGGFLQVVGEPGIGKTYLLGAVREAALAEGMQVLSGRATEFEQEMPFQILVDALSEFRDLDRLHELLRSVAAEALRPFMPDVDRKSVV